MTEEKLNEIRFKISDSIKQRREELKLSQQQLADKTGFKLKTIVNFENARFWISLKDYIIIRDALELPNIF
jgi:transcriptional regulator with XRE-family HTH domain